VGPAVELDGCPLPDDCRVDLEQEVWWRWEPDGASARVGLLSVLTSFAGPIRQLAFRPVEGTIARGRSVATVESTRFTGAVRMPVDVELLDRNPAVQERPRLLNDLPYDDGWVVRVRPVRPADIDTYLERPEAVRERLLARIRERRVRCWPRTPDVELVETGAECSAVLAKLNDEVAHRTAGEVILLVTDDPTSPIEMVRWSDQTGYPVLAQRREGTLFFSLIEKVANPLPRRRRG
jgi:glycine cleavage system H protein